MKTKQQRLIEKVLDLSESDKNSFKILYHNHIDFEYGEVENEDDITPIITDKKTGITYNLFKYIDDKTNIIDNTLYLGGLRRKP